ncbi:hypothetical protein FGO68_gene11804 [Halteria grandinella]|uniref:Uncharacterized protein n=1 Tax=Halteria grandinella TaxID=5974 RepID=A0A8J8NCY3_HALGN|nr:hypothetical protein FGO68_gene11804 [Halteria grandinella]
MFNAMSFRDVKTFGFALLDELSQKFYAKPFDKFSKGSQKAAYDEDEIAIMVAKLLASKGDATKILVIDEIDAFESNQTGFLALVKHILASKTNTIIIGIANSVDLPFRKKGSAIAMRDAQILFEPYDEGQITTIIEEKLNMRFIDFPLLVKQNPIVKKMFFSLIDERAMTLISKKVSKMNGDVRVAFDIIKSAFVELQQRVKHFIPEGQKEESPDQMPEPKDIKITLDLVTHVFKAKYGSKLPETLKCLPRQNLIILEAIVNLYAGWPSGEDRKINFGELQSEVEYLCKQQFMQDMIRSGATGIQNLMDDLQFYNIIEIEKPKGLEQRRDIKQSRFWLKVEFTELQTELKALYESKQEPLSGAGEAIK